MRSAVRRQMGRIVTAVGLVLWVTAPARGDVIVVPQSLAMVEGNSNNVFPFEPLGTTMRYQQVYSATEFSQPMLITGLLFRLDGQFQHPLCLGERGKQCV